MGNKGLENVSFQFWHSRRQSQDRPSKVKKRHLRFLEFGVAQRGVVELLNDYTPYSSSS